VEAQNVLKDLPHGPSSITVYRETEEIYERLAIGLPGARSRPSRLLCPPSEVVEPEAVAPARKSTSVKEEEIPFTPGAVDGMVLDVDSHCESSSEELIELKYRRAKDNAFGNRMQSVQRVHLSYGDRRKPSKKVSFAIADEEVPPHHRREDDRKRKRRESPPDPNDKHKKDRL
jgi:hypothetical protein